jgi:hypothetical protein
MEYSTKQIDGKEKNLKFFMVPLDFFENDEIPSHLKDLFLLISSSLFNGQVSYEFLNWKYNGGIKSPYLVKCLKKLQALGVITFKKGAFGRIISINYDYFTGQRFVNIPRNSEPMQKIYKYKNERIGLLKVFVYHYLNFGLQYSTAENHAEKIGISVKTYRKYSRILFKDGILTDNPQKKYLKSTGIPTEIRNFRLNSKYHEINHRSFFQKDSKSLTTGGKIIANANGILIRDKKHTFCQQDKYINLKINIDKNNLYTQKQFLRFFKQKKGIIEHWKEHKKMMKVEDNARQERNLGFYMDLEPKLKIYILKAIKNKVHLSGEVLDLKNVEQRMNSFISKTIAEGKNKTFQSDNQFICYMSKIVSSVSNKIYKYSDLLLDENLYILEEIEHNLRFEENSNYHVKYIRWKIRTLDRSNTDFKAYNKPLMVKHLMNVLKKDFRPPATTRDWDADYGFNGIFNYAQEDEKEMLYDEGGNNNTSETYLDFIRKIRSKSDSFNTLSAC